MAMHSLQEIWKFIFAIFDAVKGCSWKQRCTSVFCAETASSCFDHVPCDAHYSKSEKIPCQYCLTMWQYRKILHPSNVHNVMWLWNEHTCIITVDHMLMNTLYQMMSLSEYKTHCFDVLNLSKHWERRWVLLSQRTSYRFKTVFT